MFMANKKLYITRIHSILNSMVDCWSEPFIHLHAVWFMCYKSLSKHYFFSSAVEVTKVCWFVMGSGCGSVGRAVVFDTRGLRFDSSHRQNFIEHLFIINCIEKTKINKKRPGMAHFKKQQLRFVDHHATV